jgi:hypothetical protein
VASNGRRLGTPPNLAFRNTLCLQSFAADRFVAACAAAGAVRVASVLIGMATGFPNFRKEREEDFSLGLAICNYPLRIGVLDDPVWNTNSQYVFDQDAVGQDLSDVAVAGTGPRAPSGFQLDGNDTMTRVDQIVWAAGEAISV